MNIRDDAGPGLTALILCGGEARRLGGIEKPLQPLAGRALIERVIEQLRPQVADILISANRAQDEYLRYAATVLDDGAHSGRGPLAGFAAGLAAAKGKLLLCVPGDAPLLPPDLLSRLSAARVAAAAELAYVHDGGGPQPLCCLLDTVLQTDLHDYLESGGRTPRSWFAHHRNAIADFNDWPRWAWSTNTPEEWQAAEHHLRRETHA